MPFLYGKLREEVYMEQPLGYVAYGETNVYKLKKAIYDLRQSSRVWFDKFSRVIGTVRFRRCYSDHSVFIRHGPFGTIVLAIYVDILLSGSI